MSSKRGVFLVSVLIVGFIILGFFFPKETKPSESTRVILEHYDETYIAPVCFEESNPSNNIQDSTLGEAREMNYKAHSACTVDALKAEQDSIIVSMLKDWGIIDNKWDNW